MRSSRTLAGLCVLVLLVFTVFFSWTFNPVSLQPESIGLSATTPAGVTILSADGGDPMPKPIPIPSPWFA